MKSKIFNYQEPSENSMKQVDGNERLIIFTTKLHWKLILSDSYYSASRINRLISVTVILQNENIAKPKVNIIRGIRYRLIALFYNRSNIVHSKWQSSAYNVDSVLLKTEYAENVMKRWVIWTSSSSYFMFSKVWNNHEDFSRNRCKRSLLQCLLIEDNLFVLNLSKNTMCQNWTTFSSQWRIHQ